MQASGLGRDGEFWVYDGKRSPSSGLSAVAGKSTDQFNPEPIRYRDMRAGCYDSVARLTDMNRAGVLASLCVPSFPSLCGQIFWEVDEEVQWKVLRGNAERLFHFTPTPPPGH